ncbi:MAG: hypothetical protein KDD64_02955 [Bdellovibrionales bacterium]|nr:hypothetical protein [Bdellovibrionales bacterium]
MVISLLVLGTLVAVQSLGQKINCVGNRCIVFPVHASSDLGGGTRGPVKKETSKVAKDPDRIPDSSADPKNGA